MHLICLRRYAHTHTSTKQNPFAGRIRCGQSRNGGFFGARDLWARWKIICVYHQSVCVCVRASVLMNRQSSLEYNEDYEYLRVNYRPESTHTHTHTMLYDFVSILRRHTSSPPIQNWYEILTINFVCTRTYTMIFCDHIFPLARRATRGISTRVYNPHDFNLDKKIIRPRGMKRPNRVCAICKALFAMTKVFIRMYAQRSMVYESA